MSASKFDNKHQMLSLFVAQKRSVKAIYPTIPIVTYFD
jgi:hypothetical protein